MLNNTANLAIILSAIDKASPQINNVAKGFERIKQTAEQAKKAATIALSAISAAAGGATKTFIELERKISNVRTMSKMTFKEMERGLLNLSSKYGKSATDLADALYDIVSAGYDGAEAMQILESSIKGAVVGVSDIPTAVSATLTVLRSYGDEIKNADEVQKLMFAGVQKGRLTMQDLASNIGEVLPIAKSFGDSFKNALLTLSFGTQVFGGQADQTANRLQNLYQDLQQKSDAFEKLGIKIYDAQGKFLGLNKVMEQLYKLTAGKSTSETNAILNSLGVSDTAQEMILAIINNFEDYKATLEDVGNVDFESKLDEQLNTLSASWDKLKESTINVARIFGSSLAKNIKNIIDKTQKIVSGIGEWISKNKEFVASYTSTIVKILSATIGLLMIPKIIALIMSPITWLLVGVALLAGAWTLNWDGIRDKTKEVWGKIEPIFNAMKKWFNENQNKVVQWTWNILGNAWDWMKNNWEKIEPYIKNAFDLIIKAGEQLIKWTFDILGSGWNWLINNWDTISEYIKKAFSWLWNKGEQFLKWSFEITGKAWEWLKNTWKEIEPYIQNAFKYLWNKGNQFIEWGLKTSGDAWDYIKNNSLKDIIDDLKNSLNENIGTLKMNMSDETKGILNSITVLSKGVWATLKWDLNTFLDTYNLTIVPIINGLKEVIVYVKWQEATDNQQTINSIITGLSTSLGAKYLLKQGWVLSIAVGFTVGAMNFLSSGVRKDMQNLQKILQGEMSIKDIADKTGREYTQHLIDILMNEPNSIRGGILKNMLDLSKEEPSLINDFRMLGLSVGFAFADAFSTTVKEIINNLFGWITKKTEKYTPSIKEKATFVADRTAIHLSDTEQPFMSVGHIPKFATGAILDRNGFVYGPGTETSDSILARISKGEAIINAKSARKYRDLLIAINNDTLKLPGFAEGYVEQNLSYLSKFKDILPKQLKVILETTAKHSEDTEGYEKLVDSIVSLIKMNKDMDKQIGKLEDTLKKQINALNENTNTTKNNNKNNLGMGNLREIAEENLNPFRELIGKIILKLNDNKEIKTYYNFQKDQLGSLGKIFSGGFDILTGSIRNVGTLVADGIMKTSWAQNISNWIKSNAKSAGNAISGGLSSFGNAMGELGSQISLDPIYGPILDGLKNVFGGITGLLGDIFGPVIQAIMSLSNVVAILNPITTIVESLMTVVGPLINSALQPFVNILKALGQMLGTLLIPLLDPLFAGLQAIGAVLTWIYNSVIVPLGRGFYIIFGMIGSAFNLLYNIVSDVVKGLTFGVVDIGKRAVKSFGQIVREANEKVSEIDMNVEQNVENSYQSQYTSTVQRSGPEIINNTIIVNANDSFIFDSETAFKDWLAKTVQDLFDSGTLKFA
ncbi:Tail length tape measure protein [Marinitoga phage MPV1]|uniref:Phage tail tape measure protein, TP901 family n=1 Tax=Marinitoga piezophila (strain DSM 14283 / JCM 11233 / KA3) TaxID=443254 RepID=H2J4C9_MARPK|nr:phage tail tape measure protein [Marinitoga piezophila]AEX84784.1 phage tail tape measure protein, TP901 family [Marinitoga piezophila KA3]